MNRVLRPFGILSLMTVFLLASTHSLVHASEQAAAETGRGMAANRAGLERVIQRSEILQVIDGWVAQNTFNRHADPEQDKAEFLRLATKGSSRLIQENDRAIERMTEADAQAQWAMLAPVMGTAVSDLAQDNSLSARDKLMAANLRISTDSVHKNLSQLIDQAGSVQAFLLGAQSQFAGKSYAGVPPEALAIVVLALVVACIAFVGVVGGLILIIGTGIGTAIGSLGAGYAIATVLVIGGMYLLTQLPPGPSGPEPSQPSYPY